MKQIPVEIALRAFVRPRASQVWVDSKHRARQWKRGWRSCRFGERAVIFDIETTVDERLAPLHGHYQVRVQDQLEEEGVIAFDGVPDTQADLPYEWAVEQGVKCIHRDEFVEEILFGEVYRLGALCIGFRLPYDLSRIALAAGYGRGSHRRAFTFYLSRNPWRPRLRIETISSRAQFIEFVPATKNVAHFFSGRFLDLYTLTSVFTGESHTLRSAGVEFRADVLKTDFEDFGKITRESLEYCRNDVAATWSLYERLREEYALYAFASFENEFAQRHGH